MNVTKEEVIKSVIDELETCLNDVNASGPSEVIDVDLENQTITLKFKYNIVEEDNYVGLCYY
jgi:copper chaperone CopZ